MNKRFTILSTCVAAIAMWLVQSSFSNGMSDSNYSGSPASNGKCINCHTGGADLSATLNVVVAEKGTLIPTTSFKVGTTYSVAIALTGGTSMRRGVNSTIVDESGATVGTFGNPTDGKIITANGVKLFTHSPAITTGIFAYEWTPDANTPETVKIYTTGIAADGKNGNNGDQFLEAAGTLTKEKTNALSNAAQTELELFPNPCSNVLYSKIKITGSIYSTTGQKVITFSNTKKVAIDHLDAGQYFVIFTDGQNNYTKTIAKL
jgi:hypothetical protein